MTENDYEKLLRDTQAPWQNDGFGVRGPIEPKGAPDIDVVNYRNPDIGVLRPPVTNPVFPDLPALPGVSAGAVADVNTYSFKMIDASNDPKNPHFKDKPKPPVILIIDGSVSDSSGNPQFPSGMGNDDFYLQVGGDGYVVWCEITYDTSTLLITSANINQGSSIPASTLGDTFIKLGDITIESNGTVTPHNTQCGDINLAFIYGALNGAPALYLLSQMDVPQALPQP